MYHGLLEFKCPDCLVAQKATGVSPPPSSYMVGESAEGATEPATARILSRGCPDAPLPEKTQGGALLLTALCRGQNHCPRRQHTNMTLKQEPPPGRAGTGVQQKHSHRCCHCRGPGADNEVAAPGCGRLEGRPERPLWVWRKAARFL